MRGECGFVPMLGEISAKRRRLLKRSLQEPILAAPLGLEPRTS